MPSSSATVPIRFADTDTLSLRQLDELNSAVKGFSFRAFKARQATMVQGVDYFLLPALQHATFIEGLKRSGQIYASTANLLLITQSGYRRMQGPAAWSSFDDT